MNDYRFKRIFVIVMDSVGIGAAPDAEQYGDAGADTIGHIVKHFDGKLKIPHLIELGLGNISPSAGLPPVERPKAHYGKMQEVSNGKDTMTGHWEIMGLKIEQPFRTFPEGFPLALLEELKAETGRSWLGNKPASGTEIIEELGEEHVATGKLIVYTSADSVLQIAAHEDIVPLDELYRICETARKLTLREEYMVGRVIARPFIGQPGAWKRTANRHDYALKPFGRTVMNELKDGGLDSIAIGKINDIFDGEGVSDSVRTKSNMDGMDRIVELADRDFTGQCFLNLVDFDANFGHRRDPEGYGRALEEFDARLPELLAKLTGDDLLLITADHGNDPIHSGTDHTREYVPLLAYSKDTRAGDGRNLGVRRTFADLGCTVADNFKVRLPEHGSSFLQEL